MPKQKLYAQRGETEERKAEGRQGDRARAQDGRLRNQANKGRLG